MSAPIIGIRLQNRPLESYKSVYSCYTDLCNVGSIKIAQQSFLYKHGQIGQIRFQKLDSNSIEDDEGTNITVYANSKSPKISRSINFVLLFYVVLYITNKTSKRLF